MEPARQIQWLSSGGQGAGSDAAAGAGLCWWKWRCSRFGVESTRVESQESLAVGSPHWTVAGRCRIELHSRQRGEDQRIQGFEASRWYTFCRGRKWCGLFPPGAASRLVLEWFQVQAAKSGPRAYSLVSSPTPTAPSRHAKLNLDYLSWHRWTSPNTRNAPSQFSTGAGEAVRIQEQRGT